MTVTEAQELFELYGYARPELHGDAAFVLRDEMDSLLRAKAAPASAGVLDGALTITGCDDRLHTAFVTLCSALGALDPESMVVANPMDRYGELFHLTDFTSDARHTGPGGIRWHKLISTVAVLTPAELAVAIEHLPDPTVTKTGEFRSIFARALQDLSRQACERLGVPEPDEAQFSLMFEALDPDGFEAFYRALWPVLVAGRDGHGVVVLRSDTK